MPNPRNQLRKLLNNKLNIPHPVAGTLGNGDGLTVTDDDLENHVWVRIHGQGVASILNKRVSPVYGRRVLVGVDPFEPNVTQVLGTWTDAPDGDGGGAGLNYAPADRYRWMAPYGGEDPLFVELRQFLPLRVGMSDPAGLGVSIYRGMLWSGSAWLAINGQTVDLTGYVPSTSGKALLALITLDTSGTAVVTAGSEVDLAALALTDLPAVPDDTAAALAAVRLFQGQTAVQEARTNTDIIDLRFSGWGTGGTSGTGDVSGPASSTAGNLPAFSDTTGKALEDSGYAPTDFAAAGHTHVEADITDLTHTDPNAIHGNASGEIAALTEKATPAAGDWLIGEDSENSNGKVKIQVGNLPGGSGTVTVREQDGSPSVSASVIEFATGTTVSDQGSGVARVTPPAGGSGTPAGSFWNVRAWPSSAHAMDDEFDDSSLNAKWTEFDPGSHLTVAENDYGLVLTPSASGKWGGVYQTLPAGDFSATALLTFPGILQDSKIIAICLWENPADSSKRLETLSMLKYNTGGYAVQWNRWTNYTTFSTSAYQSGGLGAWYPTFRYFRMRRNGTNYYGDFSDDGISWSPGPSGVTLAFTPAAVGLGILSGATFSPVVFPFFRWKASNVTLNGILEGRRVNIYA